MDDWILFYFKVFINRECNLYLMEIGTSLNFQSLYNLYKMEYFISNFYLCLDQSLMKWENTSSTLRISTLFSHSFL
jgi:hypothetical protein